MRLYLLIFIIIHTPLASSKSHDNTQFEYSGDLGASDYLYGAYGNNKDPVFDVYRTVSLDVDLGISADCGKLDFKSTVKGALKNILDTKYLGAMGQSILAASPMLLTCYFSPTWCSILKNARLRANMLAQLRLDQCSVIDNYVDSRAEEYYQEKQDCVRSAIAKSGGNFEEAMESGAINKCKNYMEFDIKNWAGGKSKASENKLLASSATWSNFNGRGARETLSLVQSLVGDTVIKKGKVSVDFGPRRIQLTPRTHLMSLERQTFKNICEVLLPKLVNAGGKKSNVHEVISDQDLDKISDNSKRPLIDRQTLLSLAYMPQKKREMACKKLAEAVAMARFSNDMNKSIDFIISKVETNPNIPEKRKVEAARKRKALKEQIDMTLSLYYSRNKPLNEVLYQVNSEGRKYKNEYFLNKHNIKRSYQMQNQIESEFFDCSDSIFCNKY
jgi:hypothetical protein